MRLQSSLSVSVLLLCLGVSLLWVGVVRGGPQSDTVYRYTAHEVTETESGVVVTNVVTGEQVDGPDDLESDIDSELVCDGDRSRACYVTYREFRGEREPRIRSRYSYAFLDGAFYERSRIDSDSPRFERRSVSQALSDLSMPASDLTDTERAVLANGQRPTTRPLPHANELVVADGTTYTILQTGRTRYSSEEIGSPACSPVGEECGDSYRFWSLVNQLVFIALGIAGTGVGAFGVFRSRDEWPTFWRRSE